ncbi:MAG: helix-turn-helix domain-containing protein [Pseudomonadaceae bacterium]|nr:helix-turn-helix domain-containing protein [Pseudomonadaceae bacterium]
MEIPRTNAGLVLHDREVGSVVAKQHALDSNRPRKNTKALRILEALEAGSLNRFEAEDLGDHALNSTIATLRAKGYEIQGIWEVVPTRFAAPARVLRYQIVPRIAGGPTSTADQRP